jgi:phage-related minor tail protein
MPKFEKHLKDVSEASKLFAPIEQKLEDLKTAIGRLPQAPDALRVEILNRRAEALDMLKLAIKTMADKAAVVLKADVNKVKGWKDFSNRIQGF